MARGPWKPWGLHIQIMNGQTSSVAMVASQPTLRSRGTKMLTKKQKKVKKVMKEFKKGKLNIGKSDKKVKSRKQAIAIALSKAGIDKRS